MKVAVFHDWIAAVGGGEKVVLTLARDLGADVFAAGADPEVVDRAGFPGTAVTPLTALPEKPPRRIQAAIRAFSRAALEGYDAYVFSGNWSLFAAPNHRPNLMYCNTPARALYDLREPWLRGLPALQRMLARPWSARIRRRVEKTLPSVERIVANSRNVQGRIRMYWDRSAEVVHPPVAVSRFRFDRVGEAWVSVNRLSHEKRIGLQVEAFRRLPRERLLVVGGAPPGTDPDRFIGALDPPPNVEFAGEVPDAKLVDLLATCRGLIATARDEDFGMSVVEAHAAGKVVVATDEGGHRETVQPGVTGYLLRPDPHAFANRISTLRTEELERKADACRARAREFDEAVFVGRMREHLERVASSA